MKILEWKEYGSEEDLREIVEKCEGYLKRDNYDEALKMLTDNDERILLIDFLYSIGVNVLDYVTVLYDGMFWQYTFLDEYRNIVLPSNIKQIDENVFRTTNIASLDMSNITVDYIPSCFCALCGTLSSIKFPKGLKAIGSQAFSSNKSLTSINIPEGVTYLERNAFYNCTNLKTVVFPSTLEHIEQKCFCECDSLYSVEFNSGDTLIENLNSFLCSYTSGNCSLQHVSVRSTDENCNVVKYFKKFFGVDNTHIETNYATRRIGVSKLS